MSKVSPFAVQKALIGIGGEPKSVKRLRSGDLLVETSSALQTKSFLLAKSFLNSPVTISPHKTLNSCRGIISESDLLSTPDEEILKGFSSQGVIQCQRFGHSQTSCRGQLTCSRCASVGHASTDCSLEPKCINCLQPHSSDSKICPKWKIEKQLQEIKTTKNISYPEARKLIVPQLSQTYAQAAKSSTLNNSTQTDENITKIKCPPLKLLAPLSSKQRTNFPTAVTTSSSSQTQLLPSISSKYLQHQILSHQLPCLRQKGKLKIKHLNYIVPEKIAKKFELISVKPTANFKKNPTKNTSVKIAREQDSPNESAPVSKRSRRRKTSKTSDAMDTDANLSDSDYVIRLASEEDESLFEADFKKNALPLHTSLQAVAVRIHSTSLITVCCLYLSPNVVIHQQDLNNLVDQLPAPFVILGDFNGHITLWGSVKTNPRGRQIEQDLYNSDHFPVILSHDSDTGGKTFPPTYSYSRADWALFTQLAEIPDAMFKIESVDTAVQEVTNVLIAAADLSIPKVSSHSFQRYKPWWNTDCQTAHKNQRKLWGIFRSYPTTENLLAFKKAKANARRVRRQSQRQSWIRYVSSLTSSTSSKQLWKKVKAANGIVWKEHCFPSSWREAIVIPILKPGKVTTDPLSYRPIALTSCFCKTFERMVNTRLVYVLEKEKCVSPLQSGFRKGRSTLDNLVFLESQIRDAFVRRNHLVSLFFDIEKAYDRT
ncbi:putative RNA-directed DNA polymerase from transposon X-element [Trichonephila clavipes]|nr:putative RNA-directed DNA polymerase from transposon X-element [Trichonephila clavipes]